MNEDIVLNPCEGENSRLNPLKPTANQKQWLINQVINGHMTAKEIKEKYKISNIVVNNWVSRHRHGKSLHTNNGRPRALDKEGFKMIEGWVYADEHNIKDIKGLKNKLNEAYQHTKEKNCDYSNCSTKIRKMSHGTMHNYIKLVESDKFIKLTKED